MLPGPEEEPPVGEAAVLDAWCAALDDPEAFDSEICQNRAKYFATLITESISSTSPRKHRHSKHLFRLARIWNASHPASLCERIILEYGQIASDPPRHVPGLRELFEEHFF